jgi:hypothetical protein
LLKKAAARVPYWPGRQLYCPLAAAFWSLFLSLSLSFSLSLVFSCGQIVEPDFGKFGKDMNEGVLHKYFTFSNS